MKFETIKITLNDPQSSQNSIYQTFIELDQLTHSVADWEKNDLFKCNEVLEIIAQHLKPKHNITIRLVLSILSN